MEIGLELENILVDARQVKRGDLVLMDRLMG